MAAILTAAEMRALEQAAIARGEVTGLELMERAGRGVVEAILAEWPEIEQGARRAVVLCGPGNNGGDGFVVARLLKERGWDVEAFLYGDPEKLPPDASTAFRRWTASAPARPLDTLVVPDVERDGDDALPDLWIDALFGTGLVRPVPIDLGALIDHIELARAEAGDNHRSRIVAIDVPSGLDSDSGMERFEPAPPPSQEVVDDLARRGLGRLVAPIYSPLYCDLTVTFHSLKPGHLLAHGPDCCGKVVVADIGLGPQWQPHRIKQVACPAGDGLSKRTGHKYAHGHALLLSGGCGRGGAARLAARGALRIGAGLVTLAVPPAALQENAARLDAIMLRSVRDAEVLTDLLQDSRLNALAAGPGLGTSDREAALLSALLDASRPDAGNHPARKGRALVLDADALTLLAHHPALRAKLHARCVLTPHDGEFARLFPAIAERWRAPATTGPAYSKLDAARDAARECGAVVLLKGPDTVIAEPNGTAAIHAAVHDRAAPWLATAGSGDVLAGFITGLLARGLAPFEAACAAAWLHVEAARSFGPGLIAEDLPEELPKVFRALGL
ncbi:NAD(P)H-hydrate dehydratase [Rubellimicrobium aerolatum]|uniref:Bifunctional NAD(P)H-hydrate repair enzyme n=1 Tax=Rubellimicrobium aerolatum TaxID=490979 RepID=A0ABW0SBE0_9RHOB|nr:NAD(P)H-hydrate dehydratase [Rubellimicrobium aerolatum]MBP1805529.1 hydroxyethylthiazole kinase-like uncharacterized protein yjeF [Rubellimicrobium aerolatum]